MSIRRSVSALKGAPLFHLMADGYPFQEAGGRVDQRLVLVYLRAGTMAQTCMSGVGVRCTTGGTRRRQVLLYLQMSQPCVQERLGWCSKYDA